jgi:hypothetical protein
MSNLLNAPQTRLAGGFYFYFLVRHLDGHGVGFEWRALHSFGPALIHLPTGRELQIGP